MTGPTLMRQEIDEIPAAAARLCTAAAQADFARAAAALAARDPSVLVTVARGSSDHAATCLAYAAGLMTGLPVASLGPSVASIYGGTLRLKDAAAIAISQSGRSADLIAATLACSAGGAVTLALTNSPGSPLAAAAGLTIDLRAGPERSVAATKSFVNSVLSGLWLLAHWTGDRVLQDALRAMPARLEAARSVPCDALADDLARIDRLFVLARGPGVGVAGEVALKAMELCGIPASAYSAAEVLHGPARVLTRGFPVLALGAGAEPGMDETLGQLAAQGIRAIPAPAMQAPDAGAPAMQAPDAGAPAMQAPDTGAPAMQAPDAGAPAMQAPDAGAPVLRLLDRLVQLVPLYLALEAAARARGFDPDRPAFLRKETDTL